MRYMLTGDHWSADESYRMGITQMIAPTPSAALDAAVEIARKIAACGPLGIKATLASAHLVIDPVRPARGGGGPATEASGQVAYGPIRFQAV